MSHDDRILWGLDIGGLAALVLFIANVYEAMTLDVISNPGHRKRAAKRFNEHLKLFANFMNGLGVSYLVTALVAPMVRSAEPVNRFQTLIALMVAAVLHLAGQMTLRFWKSED